MARRAASLGTALLLVALSHHAWAVCGRTCASRPEGCSKEFSTLAYVVTTCRVIGHGLLGAQELRVQRRGCDPTTVLRLANPDPVPDPLGLCALVGQNHQGTASPLGGVFNRLGVTRDGTGIVFEITNAFELVGRTPLTAEQQGFFYVRADGTGLRRLGPPSRDPTYRIYNAAGKPAVDVKTRLAFNGDRLVAFTDLAPGPDGTETEQLFTIDLVGGERRQVTHLTAATPPPQGVKVIEYFIFDDRGKLLFVHVRGGDKQIKRIAIDGSELPPPHVPRGLADDGRSRVVRSFRQSGLRFGIVGVETAGAPANADVLFNYGSWFDLFSVLGGRHPIQLTNYRYGDTDLLAFRSHDVVFMTSADPVGANPFHNCELFRISPLGLGVRQLTHLDQGRPSEDGCQLNPLPGCGIKALNAFASDESRALLYYSDCDPFGTNPDGSQVFAMRWNGSRVRQITHTRGVTKAADGSVVEVEIPGPVAHGGR